MTESRRTRPLHALTATLDLRAGEVRTFGLLLIFATAALGGVYTMGFSLSTALFLSRLPPSTTPYLFLGSSIVLVVTLLLYNRLAARLRLEQAIVISSAALTGISLLFRLLLATPVGHGFGLLLALDLFIEVAFTLVLLQFWTFATQLFDPRQARRLFVFIAAGGTLAIMVAGSLLATLVGIVGAENLLFVVSLSLLACTLSAWQLGHVYRRRHHHAHGAISSTPAATSTLRRDLAVLLGSPLALAITGFVVLTSLLINTGAFQFFLALQVSFRDREAAMVAYLGRYELLAGLAALFVQLYLSRRIVQRTGVFVALMFFPVATALAAAGVLLSGGALLAFTLARSTDPVLRRTLHDATLNMLYLPLPARLRGRARELMEVVYAAAFGLAAIGFILLQEVPAWSVETWSLPMLGLGLLWLLLLAPARRSYLTQLAASLTTRQLDPQDLSFDPDEETTAQVLREALDDPDPPRVLYALELVASSRDGAWGPQVARLLEHPSAAVRIEALNILRHLGGGQEGRIAECLGDPDPAVRAAAVTAFGAVAERERFERLRPLLEDPAPAARAAAVVTLSKQGGRGDETRAAAQLREMLSAADPAWRAEGARALGLLASEASHESLPALLNDPNPEVRRHALDAAGKLGGPAYLPPLIEALADPAVADEAAAALSRYGTEALPQLEQLLEDAQTDPQTARHLPGVIADIGGAEARRLLEAKLDHPQAGVRTGIYRALLTARCSRESSLRALQLEAREAYRLRVMREDVSSRGAPGLLEQSLEARFREALERIFQALALRFPAEQLSTVQHALGLGKSSRALAVELLDTLLDPPTRQLLLPLLEATPGQLRTAAERHFGIEAKGLDGTLAELATGPDVWLRACAMHEIGVRYRAPLKAIIEQALGAVEPLERETALQVGRTLFEPAILEELLRRHAEKDPSPVVRRYARGVLTERAQA